VSPYRDPAAAPAVCPRCTDATLEAHVRGLASVLACRTCGGVFAERDSVIGMLEGQTSDLVELADEATRAPPNPKLVPIDLECPRCGILMTKVQIRKAHVPVDVCAAHGVWFDRWEAQLVAHVADDPATQATLRVALNDLKSGSS
jgi:Zn-finger nucleic acid-binding protein